LRYGIKAYISSLFSYAVIRTSMIIVAQKMSMNSVGIYSVSFAIFDVIYLMVTVFATLIFPRLTSNNDKNFQKKLVYNNVFAVVIFLIFSFFCFLLFGENLIFIAFGKQFVPAANVFFYLMPGLLFLSINTIFMNYFAAQGLPIVVIYSPAIALCVLITSMNLLIEKYGLSAAGISFSLSSFSMFIISIMYLIKINFFKLYNDTKAI
jgi:O-antigen/teichoic acid export membrane protein